jgi:hypothetical protein
MNPDRGATGRVRLEALIAADARALTAESGQTGRVFAALHRLGASDFRALLHILVAENAGAPLTSGEADRRKVILRHAEQDFDVAGAFFALLTAHTHGAILAVLIDGMRRFHNEVRVLGADVGTT